MIILLSFFDINNLIILDNAIQKLNCGLFQILSLLVIVIYKLFFMAFLISTQLIEY